MSPAWSCFDGALQTPRPQRLATNAFPRSSPSLREPNVFFERDSIRYVALDAIPFNPSTKAGAEHSLVTVVAANENCPVTTQWLDECLTELEDCDVYTRRHFLAGLIITTLEAGQTLTMGFRNHLVELGNSWVDLRYEKNLGDRLPPGPYLYSENALRPVCRLYDDKQRAFLTAISPKLHWADQTAYSQLKIAGSSYDRLAIAVPARTAGNATGTQRRLRIAVKDLYRVKGLKTSLNNLSFYDTSDEAASSAAVVESLVRDGAIVLGLTKLSSMIAREEPMDAVDFPTAFNPRGDGYQSPAGSSSGSAAAVASYPWLDCALGSDTSGSGRRPAMVNGVWQFRPSHDLVDSDGMVATYPRFDTPCIFSRELGHLDRILQSWIPTEQASYTVNPSYEIVFLQEYLPVSNPDQMALINGFIEDMLTHLPATLTKISIRDTWKNTRPTGLPERVDEYLRDVITHTYYYAFYHSTDSFRKEYSASYNGEPPYVIPFVGRRWDKGAAVTTAQHDDATKKLDVYKDWLMGTLFPSHQRLVVLPVANAMPNYRDVVSSSPDEQSALDELFLSPILGAPDIVVPIGDVPYKSRITQKIEDLPVVANVVGAPRTDFQLLRTISQVIKLSERPTSVAVGSRMFPFSLHQ
ncbi:amidase signature domain-containing protein [Xylaria telfairii]|nr:amidase signature domain-containing protein [Xylaria telfairii]